MKKVVMTLLLAALLVIPLETVALAQPAEASLPMGDVELFVHGDVPAQTDMTDSMTPALHGVVLAMVNHGEQSFTPDNAPLAWESLYNMVSLYGQLDNRSDYRADDLLLPSETVGDYASALFSAPLSAEIPEDLSDRMVYDGETDCWLVTCGENGLSEISVTCSSGEDEILVDGQLVYLVDGSVLAQFEAVLVPQDNLLGCTLVSLELL